MNNTNDNLIFRRWKILSNSACRKLESNVILSYFGQKCIKLKFKIYSFNILNKTIKQSELDGFLYLFPSPVKISWNSQQNNSQPGH